MTAPLVLGHHGTGVDAGVDERSRIYWRHPDGDRKRRSERAAPVATSANTPPLWNALALVSFLLSLVFPIGVLVVQRAGGVFQPVNASTPPAYHVGVALLSAGVLAVPLALVTGHSALDWAKHRTYRWPLRGIALVSLVLGYGAVVGYVGGAVLWYWGVTHTPWRLVG